MSVDLGADLFISVHHDGVKNEMLMPWQYNGKTHWFLDKFEGFSLWVSQKNNKYEESLSFATTLADRRLPPVSFPREPRVLGESWGKPVRSE